MSTHDQHNGVPDMAPPRSAGAIEADILEALLLDAPAQLPAPGRADALKARVLERVRGSVRGADGTLTIFSDAGEWAALAPHVHMKTLHSDTGGRSFLLRLEPGAVLPNHAHDRDEECMVVEGEIFLGELRIRAGDYHLAPGGSVHPDITSPGGALLFIRSAAGHRYEAHA